MQFQSAIIWECLTINCRDESVIIGKQSSPCLSKNWRNCWKGAFEIAPHLFPSEFCESCEFKCAQLEAFGRGEKQTERRVRGFVREEGREKEKWKEGNRRSVVLTLVVRQLTTSLSRKRDRGINMRGFRVQRGAACGSINGIVKTSGLARNRGTRGGDFAKKPTRASTRFLPSPAALFIHVLTSPLLETRVSQHTLTFLLVLLYLDTRRGWVEYYYARKYCLSLLRIRSEKQLG